MASRFLFQSTNLSSYHLEFAGSEEIAKFTADPSYRSKFNMKGQENDSSSMNNFLHHFLFRHCISSQNITLRRSSSRSLSSISCLARDKIIVEDNPSVGLTTNTNKVEFNRVNSLVWVLHESARSFSLAIQNLDLATGRLELSNAWIGVDVHAWHKCIAYQVAVYALLKAAIEVELFLSQKRCISPVSELLSAKTLLLGEFVENQLNAKQPKLVQWFRTVELPRIAGSFIPLFKKWSVEYAGSGIAGVILAISCCTAVKKLGSRRISCDLTKSIDDVLVELLDLSHGLVTVDKLHRLALEAGFENDFLLHFGKKVLPNKNIEDVEFWIGLVQKKLLSAFHRESVIFDRKTFSDKTEETALATLGIFSFLGRETRLFLSEMNIKDLDEQIKDFLSYLECGSLYIYPEFSSLPEYQLFIEVVIDEIGWLDFYAPLRSKFHHDGRRSRQHATQAEKEIILYTVLTVCYDVYSGYAHYSNSSQQPMDANLLSFLLRSQTLLSYCLEEYWAAYDKSGEYMKFSESFVQSNKAMSNSSILLEKSADLMKRRSTQDGSTVRKGTGLAGIDPVKTKTKPLFERFVREYTMKLVAASNCIWMGTRLLFIDVRDAFWLLVKQLSGNQITNRERGKINRTLNDIATLVPITILMLIPVSAVGHAAMLAAIKKYIPSLIPSPYSSKRLNLVKQLERTKKMEVDSWASEDTGRARETSKENEDDKSFSVTVP